MLASFKKIAAFVLVLLAAMVGCGLYGALHDQISYTVSPEYYTRFKFDEFNIDPNLTPRLGAAFVGWMATWWMGLPIGATLGTIGMFASDIRTMLRETARAFGIGILIAAATGLIGLVWGAFTFLKPNPVAPEDWYVPRGGVENLGAYLCAGSMHNASYTGGVIGTLVAAVILSYRLTGQRRAQEARRSASKRTA